MRKSIGTLKQDSSIVILPVDEGNAIVIMDRRECDDKLNTLLEGDSTYRGACRSPTTEIENKVAKIIKDLGVH